MVTPDEARSSIGSVVYDRDGHPIGRVGQVYVGSTGRPTWLMIVDSSTPARSRLAPWDGAEVTDAGVRVAFARDRVDAAPVPVTVPGPIYQSDVGRLGSHYGLYDGDGDAAEAMTRSEERLRVDTVTEVTGRVRIRRYVETGYMELSVPVRREKISIEELPPDDGDTTTSGRPPTEPGVELGAGRVAGAEPVEIVLHEERIHVFREVVPVERVRVSKHVVVDEETVETQLRTEHIEFEEPGSDPRPLD